MHIKKHFFAYSVVILLIFALAASYHRFMVSYDYQVSYEGYCDPATESCFVYCEDDACIEPFYLTYVERKASTLVSLCGESIIDCEAADYCQPEEPACTVTYCDPAVDEGCVSALLGNYTTDQNTKDLSSEPTE